MRLLDGSERDQVLHVAVDLMALADHGSGVGYGGGGGGDQVGGGAGGEDRLASAWVPQPGGLAHKVTVLSFQPEKRLSIRTPACPSGAMIASP